MNILKTYLKSAKFKVSEKYILKNFGQIEKFFIFFIFIFNLHFRNLWNSLRLFYSKLSFQQGITFDLIFLPSRTIIQNVRTANFFEIHFICISVQYFMKNIKYSSRNCGKKTQFETNLISTACQWEKIFYPNQAHWFTIYAKWPKC